MSKLSCLLLFEIICMVLHSSCVSGLQVKAPKNKLLYLMIDGFRYDYVDNQLPAELPAFHRMLTEGSRADYVNPIYPSISYPSWTTLVTGLYAESHGVVGNYMYDAEDKDTFRLFDADSTGLRKWWTAEPIWTTSTKSGVSTAAIFFSRCDIPYDGVVPDYCEPFITIPGLEIFRTNIDKALEKLQQGSQFVLLYTDFIDHSGHDNGPQSEALKADVRGTDAEIGYMLTRMDELGLTDQVNVVIVSDHGMKDTSQGKVNRIEMDDYLLTDLVDVVVDSVAYSNIKVTEGHLEEVYNKLKQMPGVEVYKHDDIPVELHYKDNKRIYDILIKAHSDTFLMASNSSKMLPEKKIGGKPLNGHHGWHFDEVPEIRGIFFAMGPDFKINSTIPGIDIVDVYPLLTHILGITANPNNGTFEHIKGILKEKQMSNPPNSGGMVLPMWLLQCLSCCILATRYLISFK